MAGLANMNSPSNGNLYKPPQTSRFTLHKSEREKNGFFVKAGASLPPITSRRAALLSFTTLTLSGQLLTAKSQADEGNQLWLPGPFSLPPVSNKIANEETGTRSFLKQGIYMANIGPKGSAYRLGKSAFDLLSMRDLIEQDAWSYVRQFLRLKSTFMYYDFDKVITAAPVDQKEPLTNLANKLFDSVEKLEDAVKSRSLPHAKASFEDSSALLQEVLDRMAI
ncbi:hypothetical protein AMTR_s00098p00154060 [Amborella trichopoda]|uniref:Uncharacterized protein n=2 Tax=Amborella trichopoda TaxID=13333 RepID=W1NX41_AMBTC|nr:hypothetical protein AMTR_s00098p00154060 [Amborella trichopoda]